MSRSIMLIKNIKFDLMMQTSAIIITANIIESRRIKMLAHTTTKGYNLDETMFLLSSHYMKYKVLCCYFCKFRGSNFNR